MVMMGELRVGRAQSLPGTSGYLAHLSQSSLEDGINPELPLLGWRERDSKGWLVFSESSHSNGAARRCSEENY